MRYIPIQYVKADSILAKPIVNSNGHILLNQGAKLTDGLIRKIKEMGFYSVYIKDENFDFEVEDVIKTEVRQRTRASLKNLLDSSINIKKIGNGEIKSLQKKQEEVESMVKGIVDELFTQKDIVMNVVDIKSVDDYTYGHCVNVMLLAVILGIGANLNKSQLYDLATGALLHDVGKLFIPKEILLKPEKLSIDEYKQIQEHVSKGYEFLKNHTDLSAVARIISLQHHERVDGRGYPYQLKAEEIHIFSKITTITDVYDALTSDRYYRSALPVKEAIEYILGGGGQWFDPTLTEIFNRKVNPYPLGTLVKLSSGMVGVVESINNDNFQRPVIRVVKEQGRMVIPWLCDLFKERNIVIEEIIYQVS
ncbi:HD-GYP domain-containing protein [Alkaliphilus transvaalensis]|uniref:HD-GYP domain-containing protein n=1 Tax=Alkaliphilus transvaalensis TaxID=114628 RepID=UPI00047B8559|nr:HD-GYP domain-containing protein [Alkaliphilus transvaalensis]